MGTPPLKRERRRVSWPGATHGFRPLAGARLCQQSGAAGGRDENVSSYPDPPCALAGSGWVFDTTALQTLDPPPETVRCTLLGRKKRKSTKMDGMELHSRFLLSLFVALGGALIRNVDSAAHRCSVPESRFICGAELASFLRNTATVLKNSSGTGPGLGRFRASVCGPDLPQTVHPHWVSKTKVSAPSTFTILRPSRLSDGSGFDKESLRPFHWASESSSLRCRVSQASNRTEPPSR